MSYIRASQVMFYVEGNSKDYIYHDGKKIVDYGEITNEGLVEIFATHFKSGDEDLDKYILKNLAKKLKVKLREKSLTKNEWFELTIKNMEDFRKSKSYKKVFDKKPKRERKYAKKKK